MKEEEYPALYQAADDASLKAQTAFLRCVMAYGALSIAGAGLAFLGIESVNFAVWAAFLFTAALGLSVLMVVKRYESTWYRARAVAESIKTASWRFMMRAEPFAHLVRPTNEEIEFTELLRKILNEHKDLAYVLSGKLSEGDQITRSMRETRRLTLGERMQTYRKHRIDEQRSWYAEKSENNRISGGYWFSVFVAFQSIAIVFTILRVAYPHFKFWPAEISIVAAASVFGWIQIKRFREVAAAYGLAAHEIGLARVQLGGVKTEKAFSKFVGDTENAFSREHTQWVARRDVGP